jgi:hypothetical protein
MAVRPTPCDPNVWTNVKQTLELSEPYESYVVVHVVRELRCTWKNRAAAAPSKEEDLTYVTKEPEPNYIDVFVTRSSDNLLQTYGWVRNDSGPAASRGPGAFW